MKLKVLDELILEYKLTMQPFLDQPMNADFAKLLAAALSKKFGLNEQVTSVSIGAYCDGTIFDRKIRLRLATRLAYFSPRLGHETSPSPIGKFSEFTNGEEIAVEFVGVAQLEGEKRPTIELKILVKTGSPAGHVTSLNLSYGSCYRMARLLGYSLKRSYNMDMPWMLSYLQCTFIVGEAGPKLVIADTAVNTYQKTINKEIISRRTSCPIDAPFLCIECERRNGPFAPQTNYCEGAVRK